jgi:methionyl-tRNA synthetase
MNPLRFGLLIGWSLARKGWALWRAARMREVGWYMALLVVNTVGIFEIIYLTVTNRKYNELYGRIIR